MSAGTVAMRAVWPFTRQMGDYQLELAVLREAGLDELALADPERRIPKELALRLLAVSIEKTGKATLGLKAGETTEAGDFGVFDYAARAAPDLRGALTICEKYMTLLDDTIDVRLVEEGDLAFWRISTFGHGMPVAWNEFVVSSSLTSGARFLGARLPPTEVHLAHSEPTDAAEYDRVFAAPVRLGRATNGIVMPRQALDLPLPNANPELFAAFERQARQQLEELIARKTMSARVKQIIIEQLSQGETSMTSVCRRLHLSVATLRRRLDEEGTTHRQIVDEVRRETALREVADRRRTISEIAARLGFSSVGAFGKAFRRWVGVSPLDYRDKLEASR